MIALVAAFLLAATADQSRFPGILGQGGSIQLPPPIDEQVRPYKACLLGRFERDPRLAADGVDGWQAVNAEAVAVCVGARRTAAAESDSALRSKRAYRNAAKRRASIEKVLSDIDSGLILLHLATVPAPNVQLPAAPIVQVPSLTDDQAAIVYDQCLARAAARASRTDAADTAIFGIARADCADTRMSLLRVGGSGLAQIFDAIDSDREASFPERTRKVREQRRAFEARSGTPK